MKWADIGILFALVLTNGFFAGSELALVSARKARLRALANRGSRGARCALELLEDPTRLLSSVQIGITLVGILTGVYSGAAFADDLARVFRQAGWLSAYADEVAFGVVVVVVTYVSLVLGELVPKRLALAHAESIAVFVSRPMMWVARIGAPLVWLLRVSTETLARLLPVTAAPQESVTEDELRALISEGTKEGVFHNRERELMEGVLRLADRTVASVMVPRGDILWLDLRESPEALWQEARRSGHTRFLLCEGDLERMLGVITLGDLGEALRLGRVDAARHVRAPLVVPAFMTALRLLDQFRGASVHLAVVTGEYGDIQGLVTPADLLSAIAGDMAGELPEARVHERAEAVRRADGSWLVDGQMSIHELERVFDRADLASGDNFHTAAGFLLWHLGRLPVVGEILDWRDLRFEVVDMDGQRIDKLLVAPRPAATVSEGDVEEG